MKLQLNTNTITPEYPFKNLNSISQTLAFNNEDDAKFFAEEKNNGRYTGSGRSMYVVEGAKIANYEPVMVGQTIDFASKSNVLNITRAANAVNVSVVGCVNSSLLRDYINNPANFEISEDIHTKITFNTGNLTPGANGIIVIKLESGTGYCEFYFVMIFNNNNTSFSNVNNSNNTNLQSEATGNTILNQTGSTYTIFGNNYIDVAKKLGLTEIAANLGKSIDENIFKFYYISSSLTVTDNDINEDKYVKADVEKPQDTHTVLTSTSQIESNINYIKVKVAVLYNNNSVYVSLGTATFFIQPTYYETSNNSNVTDTYAGIKSGE